MNTETKRKKVVELIAAVPEYEESDHDSFMSTPDNIITKQHNYYFPAATLPGTAGARQSIQASRTDSDESLDDYGTGVQTYLPQTPQYMEQGKSDHAIQRDRKRLAEENEHRRRAAEKSPTDSERVALQASHRRRAESAGETLDDYGTGVNQRGNREDSASRTELTGKAREAHERLEARRRGESDEDLDAYGTGVNGDTSAAEHREAERQAEAFVRAIESIADENGEE